MTYYAQEMDARELVLEALRTLDIDQAALAKRLKRSQATVSRWVSGTATPDYESCLRLAKITGKPARSVVEAAGLDPLLVPEEARDEIDARRQRVRDQLEDWISAVGSENEDVFWRYLIAQGQATVDLLRAVGTAINAGTEAADNAAVSARAERGRPRRNGPNGQIMANQHALAGTLPRTAFSSNRRHAA